MSLENDSAFADGDFQKFLTVEKVKTQFHEQVHSINEICWDTCVDRPSSKLDGRTQTCIINCVERFIDTTLVLTNRFATMLQQSGGNR